MKTVPITEGITNLKEEFNMDKKIQKIQKKIEELEDFARINTEEIPLYVRGIEITEVEMKKMKATKKYRVETQLFQNSQEKQNFSLLGRTYKDCEDILRSYKSKINSLDKLIEGYRKQVNSLKGKIVKREEMLKK